jgi:hypothetical protein
MHVVEEGLLKKKLTIILAPLPEGDRDALNEYGKALISGLRSAAKTMLPRIDFTRGWSNLKLIMADEIVGTAWGLSSLIMATDQGKKLLAN